MSGDPALTFWRHYAEREGALTDDDGERILMVLPRSMQERFGLSETIAATSDPGLAREEGALLLIPGHPVLDAAAGHVLEEGDSGQLWAGWPARSLPTAGQLLAAAREGVGVDHGRIDAGGVPMPRYAPVLRVGVQVTYSLHDRFYEREEAWVDAAAGLPLTDDAGRQLGALPQLQGKPPHPALEPGLTAAVGAAHRQLEERAEVRLKVLAQQAVHIQEDEQALAENYYRTALESIAQRRGAALPERRPLLDAQAETTRAEWARRKHEIQQKFEARHELRPVRLHLWWIPAMTVPVVIRRGGRGFPFSLTWWLPTGGFAPVRCPSCGSGAPLVAARDRLGCRACLAPAPLPAAPVPRASPAGSRAPKPAAAVPQPAAERPVRLPEDGRPAADAEAPTPDIEDLLARALETARQRAREYEKVRARVTRIGDTLGFTFWQAVVGHDSWPRKRASPDSPLRVLYHVYGAEGPLRAIGLPPGAVPVRSSSLTHDPAAGVLHCTDGLILTRDAEYPFSLHWRIVGGKPAVEEVLPALGATSARIAMKRATVWAAASLYGGAPSPRVELDPVAAALWSSELPISGLPVLVRCLAAWGRLQGARLPEVPAAIMAAALSAVVGRRAGLVRTKEGAAADYAADPGQVAATARVLQALLGLAPDRWW
ncbi:MAG: hypothetical protein ACYDCB_08240 [Candidatus Dormibacteria bacterium]